MCFGQRSLADVDPRDGAPRPESIFAPVQPGALQRASLQSIPASSLQSMPASSSLQALRPFPHALFAPFPLASPPVAQWG
eukprot:scaffold24268_cov99-Isochrysis_galbana.AAC.1